MSLISRFFHLIAAKFNAFLGRAENPDEMLDYSYEQMLQQQQKVKRGIADVVTAKKRIEFQTTKLESNAVKLDTQAKQALLANREDLARLALERKAFVRQQLQTMTGQVAHLQEQQDKLVAGEQRLDTKIAAFRTEKEVIKANFTAAEAQVRIGEAATGIGKDMEHTGLAIQRARDRTDQMTARANALDELTAAGSLEDFTSFDSKLDRELAEISRDGEIDADLKRLRAEIGSGSEATAIER